MGRRRRGERALGPYFERDRGKWKVILAAPDGSRVPKRFESEAEAKKFKQALDAELVSDDITTTSAREKYEAYLKNKGNKEGSVSRTLWSISTFFPVPIPLWALTDKKCEKRYKTVSDKYATDSHRGMLAEVKTFMRWCVKKRWVPKSPVEHIEGVGRRKKGKKQLRNREARKWLAKAVELADAAVANEDIKALRRVVAAMMTLILAERCSEITGILVRDVDDDDRECGLLWIADSKTEAGKRTLEVPELLRVYLMVLVSSREPEDWLFPAQKGKKHSRDWPRAQVKRICKLAKVPEITAHGMRGTHSTLAEDVGVTGAIVAKALGHENERITHESYSRSEEPKRERQRKAMRVLKGGKQ